MLTAQDLALMQGAQEGYLPDTCKIHVYGTGSPDSRGYREPSFTVGGAISCGLSYATTETDTPENTHVNSDAQLRLPWDTVVSNLDRIEITHRHGSALSASLIFEVVGVPVPGPSALLVNLKRVVL